MTSVLERRRELEERMRKEGRRQRRIRMRVESETRDSGAWDRRARMLDRGTGDPFATEPRDADFDAGRIAGLIRILVTLEEVHLNVPNDNYERIVREFLKARRIPLRRVFFHHIPTNEAWARDHGPAFVLRKRRGKTEAAIVDWGFNAWGGKYPPWDADDNVPTRIAEDLRLPVFYPGIVMEGGAVDFNGSGTVMTTTSCLLNKNRNRGVSKVRIEQYLKDYYGQTHVIWLGEGIDGDDTDGHIDDLARFIDERT